LFVKWLSEPTQQRRWLDVQGDLPTRRSVGARMGDYLAANPRYGEAWNLLLAGTTTAEPAFAGYDEVRTSVVRAFDAILDGADVVKTLADLDAQAARIHARTYP
jgi:ABC-type glycerol-3-phosphate transport system substrate-binding protein